VTALAAGIVRTRWRPFRLGMRHRFEAAHGALDDRQGILVEVTTKDGSVGIGEASPMASLGQGTLSDVVALIEVGALRAGATIPDAPAASALRCALDVALLDARARAQGTSVAALLGEGAPATWVMANAVIGAGSVPDVARHGQEAVAAGYAVLKMKVGVVTVAEDYRRLSALREACPEVILRVDANGAWDEKAANEATEAFASLDIELIEQPVPASDVEALARVRERSPIRIAADESVVDPATLTRILALRAADLIVLKPMLLGGLTPAYAIARRAAECGIGAFVTTTFDSSVGTAAALQLAASLPADAAHGLSTGEHLATDVVAQTLVPVRGRMVLPSTPGLGVAVDDAALEAVATGPWREA